MTRPVVVDIKNISLAYKMYRKPVDLLWEGLLGGVRHDTFWALKNISFEVYEGQRLGLIGPNGAGKSTLLQLIAGNLAPTSGKIKVNGKISSLLSLSPVWNVEDTGVENIKFNLMVQGAKPKDIARLTEEIIDFTELGPFIQKPVRTYSSGMSARLAFAIATSLDPEILIIDEVLGAGDAYFMSKATRRMEEFCNRGRALLFVSHSTASIMQFCDRAIWLENGTVRLEGDVEYVMKQYELDFRKAEDEATRAGNQRDLAKAAAAFADVSDLAWVQFRIVPASGDKFTTSHYIKSILIDGLVTPATRVNLATPEKITKDIGSALDVFGSEWGRIYEWRGVETRILTHAGGRDPGGRFRVRATIEQVAAPIPFSVDLEWAGQKEGESEDLAVEYFDLQTTSWVRCDAGPKKDGANQSIRQRFQGAFTFPESHAAAAVVSRIETANQLPVEIEDVRVIVDGQPTTQIKERQPFVVEVDAVFRQPKPKADVGIKIIRSDGVYIYWQSSGQNGGNLIDAAGRKTVKFKFDSNQFGAGDYIANVYVADGWDFPSNYPYSRVFDRRVSAAKFHIYPEFGGLDFGVINQRVPVEVV